MYSEMMIQYTKKKLELVLSIELSKRTIEVLKVVRYFKKSNYFFTIS